MCVSSLICVISGCAWCSVFFFFKQKTAYEMRISDWSSDVCSSDLMDGRTADDRAGGRTFRKGVGGADRFGGGLPRAGRRGERGLDPIARLVLGQGHADHAGREIGRASCRERVCQYV